MVYDPDHKAIASSGAAGRDVRYGAFNFKAALNPRCLRPEILAALAKRPRQPMAPSSHGSHSPPLAQQVVQTPVHVTSTEPMNHLRLGP